VRPIIKPNLIQKVYKFDKRLQSFERKYEQQFTRDKKSPILSVYVGWRIADPRRFLESFNGDLLKAEQALENVVRDAKNSVIGSHDFTDLISPNPEQVKFDVIEGEMRGAMAGTALSAYGIDIQMVGIKELGLPESLTGKVFERMKTEREKLVKKYQGEGNAEADRIRSEADLQRKKLVAEAENQSQKIYGEAEAEATKHYDAAGPGAGGVPALVALAGGVPEGPLDADPRRAHAALQPAQGRHADQPAHRSSGRWPLTP